MAVPLLLSLPSPMGKIQEVLWVMGKRCQHWEYSSSSIDLSWKAFFGEDCLYLFLWKSVSGLTLPVRFCRLKKMLTGRGRRKFHKSCFLRFKVRCCKGKWLVQTRKEERQGSWGLSAWHSQGQRRMCPCLGSAGKDSLCLRGSLLRSHFYFLI